MLLVPPGLLTLSRCSLRLFVPPVLPMKTPQTLQTAWVLLRASVPQMAVALWPMGQQRAVSPEALLWPEALP
jgi:hypothetical protein